MIRKLHSADHEALFSLLKRDPSKNLFIIGDIEIYGFHRSPNWNGFVTSIFTITNELITELHEYYSPRDDNILPQWREDLKEEERC
ncbi:MAG: hypothetical protein FWF59_08670 [Turicibacter sp.]|nr:hypothetical protein [Turicibacter sp.]